MAWKESWQLKARRRLQKPINRVVHGNHHFISKYRGADFLLRPSAISALEISAKIAEHAELTNFTARCADLRPHLFIDIGANIGLYSCILLKSGSAPRAILFEPDRRNLIQLKANLLINDLLDLTEVHEIALGEVAGRLCLVPGETDGGFSQIVDGKPNGISYEVEVAKLDDLLSIRNQRLAIKIDVERYECKVLSGMMLTLRQNKCLIQIEAFETRDQVIAMMEEAGYIMIDSFSPNFVFIANSAECRAAPSPGV
jgi:FkbM family methyltransferase